MTQKPASPWKQLTGYQWLVLLVAWLGWVFDSMDALIYAQVMTPALKELLGARGSPQNIGWYGGIIFSIFIVGWALGGVLFGVLADYLGRSRVRRSVGTLLSTDRLRQPRAEVLASRTAVFRQ